MGMGGAFTQGVWFNGPLQVSWLSRSTPKREITGSILRGRERMCVCDSTHSIPCRFVSTCPCPE
eukprot:1562015-Prymnesium_polylepis.1